MRKKMQHLLCANRFFDNTGKFLRECEKDGDAPEIDALASATRRFREAMHLARLILEDETYALGDDSGYTLEDVIKVAENILNRTERDDSW